MPRYRVLVSAAVLVAGLSGCAPSAAVVPSSPTTVEVSPVTPSAVPTMTAREGRTTSTVAFRTLLQSQAKDTHTAGSDGQVLYGWNNLVGPTVFDDAPAQAQLQGSVWYVGGSGPFNGFLTLTFTDGSTLGMAMDGTAAKSGSTTTFIADLVIIGGTGRYADATGGGSWTGKREGALGSGVLFNGEVEVTA